MDVYVLSQWWTLGGKESEESIFSRFCSEKLKLSRQDCSIFHELALLSGNATLHGHYCPEGDYRACWDAFTGDDRLGGLQQIGKQLHLSGIRILAVSCKDQAKIMISILIPATSIMA